MTRRMYARYYRRLYSVVAVFVSASLLLALTICSLTAAMLEESHDGGDERAPSHHNEDTSEDTFCCTSLACILPVESGSDARCIQRDGHPVDPISFVPTDSAGYCTELRSHAGISWNRGPPFFPYAEFFLTPCGLRAPPVQISV